MGRQAAGLKTDANPLYLKVNLAGGHGAARAGIAITCARSLSNTRSFSMQWEGAGSTSQSTLRQTEASGESSGTPEEPDPG